MKGFVFLYNKGEVRIMKILEKGDRDKLLENYRLTGNLGIPEKEELRAFYTGDFLHGRELTIGEMLFYLDEKQEFLVLPLDEQIKYPVEMALSDGNFILIVFNNVEDVPFEMGQIE